MGYAYVSGVGHVGPLAVAKDADTAEALRAALSGALALGPEQLSVIVPGRAHRILDAALALGFRIDEPFVLLSSQPFGTRSNYLPSNPGFM